MKKTGQSGAGVGIVEYTAAALCLVWAFSRGILERVVIYKGMGGEEALEGFDKDSVLVGVVLLLQVISFCAVPLLAYILAERLKEGGGRGLAVKLFLWGVVMELPYNMITEGRFFASESRNPIFAALICTLFFGFCEGLNRRTKYVRVMKAAVLLSAVSWLLILRVDEGLAFLTVFVALYATGAEKKKKYLCASLASAACIVFSPFYVLSPLSFGAIYLKERGEKGTLA